MSKLVTKTLINESVVSDGKTVVFNKYIDNYILFKFREFEEQIADLTAIIEAQDKRIDILEGRV